MTEREAMNTLLKAVHEIALESIDSDSRALAHKTLQNISQNYLKEGTKVRLDRIEQMVDDGLLLVYDYRYDKEITGNRETAIYKLVITGPLDTYALWVVDTNPDDYEVWSIDGVKEEE